MAWQGASALAWRTVCLCWLQSVMPNVLATPAPCFVALPLSTSVRKSAAGLHSQHQFAASSHLAAIAMPDSFLFRRSLFSKIPFFPRQTRSSLRRATHCDATHMTTPHSTAQRDPNFAWRRPLAPSHLGRLDFRTTSSQGFHSMRCGAVEAEGASGRKELPARRLCVAPMMDWTDRFDRYFLRLFSSQTWLYTEMITTGALIHGDRDRHLRFNTEEHPVAVQLGGSEPEDLAKCAKMCEEYGYDEINLNVGCPSERVSSGSFGACLMAEPELVSECLSAMGEASTLPITIKHRIGIDDQDSYEHLYKFVDTVQAKSPARTFIVHARTAILKGLSPKQNREIPPLKYDFVHQLKRDFPHLEVLINGGINDLAHAATHLQHVDGVMIGRAAYNTPFQVLAEADRDIYGMEVVPKTRQEVLEAMVPFVEAQLAEGTSLNSMTRHMLGLFHGCKGGKAFRRHLSDHVHKPDAGIHTLLEAAEKVPLAVRQGLVPDNPKGPIEEMLLGGAQDAESPAPAATSQ